MCLSVGICWRVYVWGRSLLCILFFWSSFKTTKIGMVLTKQCVILYTRAWLLWSLSYTCMIILILVLLVLFLERLTIVVIIEIILAQATDKLVRTKYLYKCSCLASLCKSDKWPCENFWVCLYSMFSTFYVYESQYTSHAILT